MTTDELRAAADRLVQLHTRFAPLFGRKEARAQSQIYLNGLLLATGRKEFFCEGKSYLGMAQYKARAWSSWHRHMSLVGLAHLYVTLTRMSLKKNAGADAGYGPPLAEKRVAAARINTRRCHGHRGLPFAAE
jgi:SRSO17 transposase